MWKIFSKRQESIGKAASLIALFTISAQILAILKSKLLANYFGASTTLDIYNTAFKIPDLIFLLFGTIATGTILIPFFHEKEAKSKKELEDFQSRFFNSFLILILFITGIIFFAIPEISSKFFPKYQNEEKELLVQISRILLLSPIFISLASFFISINQKNKIFFPAAITGLLYNLSIIFGLFFLSQKHGILGVTWSVVFGAFLYFVVQLFSIFKEKLFSYKINFLNKKESLEILKTALPRTLSLSIFSLVIIYFYYLMSKSESSGLVSIFNFAFILFMIPINLVFSSLAQASMPTLSKFYSQKKNEEFNETSKKVFSKILFFSLFFSAFMILFSDLISATLYGSEKFNFKEIKTTALILSILSIIIPLQAISGYTFRIFYARRNTLEALWNNLLFLTIIFILSFTIPIKENLAHLNKDNFLANFEIIFNLSLIYLLSYIITNQIILWKLRKELRLSEIFSRKKVWKILLINFSAVLILGFIWEFFNFQYSLNFWENTKKLILFGGLYILFLVVLYEIFREENYLFLKEKLLLKFKARKKN